MLFQLLLHKAQNGNIHFKAGDPSSPLYNWVLTQRKIYQLFQDGDANNSISADRINVLNTIGFAWNVGDDAAWDKHYKNLLAYKTEFGDVRVPRQYTKHPKLGEWVTDQRRQHKLWKDGKLSTMTEERCSKLDVIGFLWKVRERADWNDRYEQLLEFKKEVSLTISMCFKAYLHSRSLTSSSALLCPHFLPLTFPQNGHCVVPQHWSENRPLGKWVAKQREQYRFYCDGKHSFLTEERIDLLNSCNFSWKIKGRSAKTKQKYEVKPDKVKEKSLVEMEEEEMHEGMHRQLIVAAAAEVNLRAASLPNPNSHQQQLMNDNLASMHAARMAGHYDPSIGNGNNVQI